jgi:transposase
MSSKRKEKKALEELSKEELIGLVRSLLEEVERLKQQVKQTSQTSSKPPSSDILTRSERKAGKDSEGEDSKPIEKRPGRKGKTRKGFGRVDRIERIEPVKCEACGSLEFESSGAKTRRYQVAELVERPIEIVEYEQVRRHCCGCGREVCGELPASVIPGQAVSAKLQGMLAWLGHYGHLSYGKQQEWLEEIGQIRLSVGTLSAVSQRVAQACEVKVKELGRWIREQKQVQVDESPWLVNGVKEWMWTLSGEGYSLFHAADTRSRRELEQLLGVSFAGVLISDDFSVYNGYPAAGQQKCLAHLRRHFKRLTQLKVPDQKPLAEAFLVLIDEAFDQHRRWRETHHTDCFMTWASGFKQRLSDALENWSSRAGYDAGLLLTSLRDKAHQWWYFLDHPQVPPDNNRAERSLRLAVTKRKVSGGSRSWSGFRQTATLLTVIQSCRAQGRSALTFFQQVLSFPHPSTELSLIPSSL